MLKRKILSVLEKACGNELSGQKMAEMFGVSRNAVWKSINQLKNEGYEITSSIKKGYALLNSNNIISAESIFANLPERHKNVKVIFFDEIDSTNNECKRMLANGFCETAIIIAEKQNSGRGRQGKSFYSPPKTGIYFSVILDPMVKLANSVTVTAAASVAVLRAIKDTTGILAQIKWVNDIYFNNKKICGILTEAITDFESQTVQNIIIGVGINVFTSEFPDSLGNIASSLGSSQLNRSKILAAAASNLLDMDVSKGLIPYLDEYRANSVLLGRKIDYYVNTVLYHATVVGISDDGGLMIENENGTSDILKSGEISVKFL